MEKYISPCNNCNNTKITLYHKIENNNFYLWIGCLKCKMTSNSCQCFIDVVKNWNNLNKHLKNLKHSV